MKTRILALLLVLTLLLCGCSAPKKAESAQPKAESPVTEQKPAESANTEESAEPGEPALAEEPAEPEEPEEDPLPEVFAADWKEAFQLGNDAYDAEDWRLAEAYYLLAESFCEGEDYPLWDAKNNRGLALLQQGKGEEALAVYDDLLMQDKWRYGYWMNYLIAGYADGKTAEELLESERSKNVLQGLVNGVKKEPGTYQKLLYGVYYNIIYMDMEQADSLTNTDRYLPLEEYGNEIPLSAFDFSLSEEQYAFFMELLGELDEMNIQTYGESDPELEELMNYLLAKSEQEQS